MNRREFMVAASGVAGGAGAATAAPPVAAQDDGGGGGDGGNTSEGGNETEGGGGGGETVEIVVGPDGNPEFDPAEVTIAPGTTVVWTWDSDNHNVVPDGIPEDADWEGHEDLEGAGFEYEHTFDVEGEYHYVCTPHEQQGMVGDIIVEQGAGGGGGGGGGGGTEEVVVGPDGDFSFDPEELTIQPGTTVLWTWDSDNHNVNPDGIPDESDWEGHEPLENEGFEYEHTFEVEGEYHYVCDPHEGNGMVGDIVVQEGGGGGEGGGEEVDIHDLGVPIQKHFVGIASIFAISVSLVFTFYLLKYGESAHTSSPGRR